MHGPADSRDATRAANAPAQLSEPGPEARECPKGKWPLALSPKVEAGGEASLFNPESWTRGPAACLPCPAEDLEDFGPVFEPDRGRAPSTPTCSEAESTQSDWRSGAWAAPPELPVEILDLGLD